MQLVSNIQLAVNSLLIGAVAGLTVIAFQLWHNYRLLPTVEQDVTGTCLRVINYQNGDAYNCSDVDVVLRNYKKINKLQP